MTHHFALHESPVFVAPFLRRRLTSVAASRNILSLNMALSVISEWFSVKKLINAASLGINQWHRDDWDFFPGRLTGTLSSGWVGLSEEQVCMVMEDNVGMGKGIWGFREFPRISDPKSYTSHITHHAYASCITHMHYALRICIMHYAYALHITHTHHASHIHITHHTSHTLWLSGKCWKEKTHIMSCHFRHPCHTSHLENPEVLKLTTKHIAI